MGEGGGGGGDTFRTSKGIRNFIVIGMSMDLIKCDYITMYMVHRSHDGCDKCNRPMKISNV